MLQVLTLNGVALKTPAQVTWALQNISSSDSGRTQTDGTMHNTIIAQKVKLTCTWGAMPISDASTLLKAINSNNFSLRYFDVMQGNWRTAIFYDGDRTAKIAWLLDDSKVVENVACDFIEV